MTAALILTRIRLEPKGWIDVGKGNNNEPRYSDSQPDPTTRQRASQDQADHAAKEQHAAALVNQGRLQEAEAVYRELISEGTGNHAIFNNLGVLLGKRGELAAAIESYKKAIELNPENPNAYYNLGKIHKRHGDLALAIASYEKAIELNPNDSEVHLRLGNALNEKGDRPAAIDSYKKALELEPNYPDAYNNLGNALKEQGDLAAAIDAYGKALELKPNFPEAYYNLGNALKEQGCFAAAIDSYNRALALRPNFPSVYLNLGTALKEQGDLAAAIGSYNKALELRPNYPEVRWNSSLTLLSLGEYKAGWRFFGTRFLQGVRLDAHPKCPLWRGEPIAHPSRLLLVTEQGIGDTLQFMRYIIHLRRKGIDVLLCAPAKLHSLITASGLDQNPLTPEQASAVTQGYYLPLMSLPTVLGVTPESPLIAEPYIRTASPLIEKWKQILSGEKKPIIGINWQGNPAHEKSNLSNRSLPLHLFAPIAKQTGVSLLSLQKGFGSEQLEACAFKDCFVGCQPQVDATWDFLETAAIISNCDLILTSDTSVAHLAGGMGKPTWLLLKTVPDWRWGLEGDNTFWYPSMRLFRQKERGNWQEVMARVVHALLEEFPAIAAETRISSSLDS